jgi:hypothetical protein
MKLLDLAKRVFGSTGETLYRATFAGGLRFRVMLRDDGSVLCDPGNGVFAPPGYLLPVESRQMRAAKWKPPLPLEVRRAIWPSCAPSEHRPQALAVGPFQRCRDCGADLQAERECPACEGTGYVNGIGDGCEDCGRTGQLGWREAE